jgi:type III pantothenate kinase
LGFLSCQHAVWRVASVHRGAEQRLRAWVVAQRPGDDYRTFAHEDFALRIEVERPERVGLDRIAAARAANTLRTPGQPAIVIDAGTAITVDALSADGAFLGGAILPGIPLAARSLAAGTDRLPDVAVDPHAPPSAIGRSTEAAIRSGLYWGTVGAVRELVQRTQHQLGGQAEIFVGGGDGLLLLVAALPHARHVPQLVLAGIALACSRVTP